MRVVTVCIDDKHDEYGKLALPYSSCLPSSLVETQYY